LPVARGRASVWFRGQPGSARRLKARKLDHRALILKADLAAWLEALPEAVITDAKS
jgi:hypothetical protein